ncbi:MAG TPA: hypothetical protein VFQ43_08135 [Nitrososphaera sp.]|nr:hypothetical protein [Nitrososphaera sp.]
MERNRRDAKDNSKQALNDITLHELHQKTAFLLVATQSIPFQTQITKLQKTVSGSPQPSLIGRSLQRADVNTKRLIARVAACVECGENSHPAGVSSGNEGHFSSKKAKVGKRCMRAA